jgi:ElaB/YqjD/DUF883 family membrane-anchored ribosome-binding protein
MIQRNGPAPGAFTDQTEELKARASEFAAQARERLAEGNEFVKDYITKQPARALGVALGLGVLLGWLIKRR